MISLLSDGVVVQEVEGRVHVLVGPVALDDLSPVPQLRLVCRSGVAPQLAPLSPGLSQISESNLSPPSYYLRLGILLGLPQPVSKARRSPHPWLV